jgi:hypothetical protein
MEGPLPGHALCSSRIDDRRLCRPASSTRQLGQLTRQFTRGLRGLPTGHDLSLNLLASELPIAESARMAA